MKSMNYTAILFFKNGLKEVHQGIKEKGINQTNLRLIKNDGVILNYPITDLIRLTIKNNEYIMFYDWVDKVFKRKYYYKCDGYYHVARLNN